MVNDAIVGQLLGKFADGGQPLVDAAGAHPTVTKGRYMGLDNRFAESTLAGCAMPDHKVSKRTAISALGVLTGDSITYQVNGGLNGGG